VAYAACCGRWHAGSERLMAPDAETLMRSRYSAYALGLAERQHRVQDESHATVEFVAVSKLGGRAHRLRETSRFVRAGGRWLYLDAQP
jgi:SEC-C motif domain protein